MQIGTNPAACIKPMTACTVHLKNKFPSLNISGMRQNILDIGIGVAKLMNAKKSQHNQKQNSQERDNCSLHRRFG